MPDLKNVRQGSPSKYPELDWLRGVAAIFIVLYHYTTRYQEMFGIKDGWIFNVPWGCGAVNAFFLLSGFLTALTLRDDTKFTDYVKKRAVRLYPGYWTCLILTTVVVLLLWRERFVGIGGLVINLTMFQSFFGIAAVDGAYWTLMYELQFYIYVAALLLMKKAKWLKPLAFIGIIASAVVCVLSMPLGDNIVFKLAKFALLGDYGIAFFGGIMLCGLKKNIKDPISWVGAAGGLVLSFFMHTLAYFVFYAVAASIIVAVIVFHNESHEKYAKAVARLAKGGLRPLEFIASISFPLYLLHQYIGMAIMNSLGGLGLVSEWIIVIPILISICLAYIVHRFVELPILKLAK